MTYAPETSFLQPATIVQRTNLGAEKHVPLPTDGHSTGWSGRNPSKHPWYVADHVKDHHKVVNIVVIARRDVNPASAGQRAYNAE